MVGRLSDLDGALDAETLDRLGDPILYTSSGGGAPTAIRAFIGKSEKVESYSGSGAVTGDRGFELRLVDVPERPTKADTITFGGVDYEPVGAMLDESGRWWVGKLKKKPA